MRNKPWIMVFRWQIAGLTLMKTHSTPKNRQLRQKPEASLSWHLILRFLQ